MIYDQQQSALPRQYTKPLQGAGFRLFRQKVIKVTLDYDNNAKRVNTYSLLLPKPKKAGVVPHEDLKMLAKAMRVTIQKEDPKFLSPPAQCSDSRNGRMKVCVGRHGIQAWKQAILGGEREAGDVPVS